MTKLEKLAAAIKKAHAEGDNETIVKIKRALYYAKVQAADKKEEVVEEAPTDDFITKSKRDDADNQAGRKIRTDIPRPNLFYDPGVAVNEQEKEMYTKPPVQRSRSRFKMVDAECHLCDRKYEIHPTEYAQRRKMEGGQFICDACIGNRFRR